MDDHLRPCRRGQRPDQRDDPADPGPAKEEVEKRDAGSGRRVADQRDDGRQPIQRKPDQQEMHRLSLRTSNAIWSFRMKGSSEDYKLLMLSLSKHEEPPKRRFILILRQAQDE